MRVSLTKLLISALLLLTGLSAYADEQSSREIISQYLTPHTIAGVRVQLERVDLAKIKQRLVEAKILTVAQDREALQQITLAHGLIGSFAVTGGDELWLFADLQRPDGSFAVLTISPGEDQADNAEAIANTIRTFTGNGGPQIEVHSDHLLLAFKPPKAEPAAATDVQLPESLFADRNQAITAFITPTADHRRAAMETLPALPEPFSNIDLREIVRNSDFAMIDVGIEPLDLQVTVHGQDAAAAEKLRAEMDEVLDSLVLIPELTAAFPQIMESLTAQRWKTNDTSVTLAIGDSHGNLAPFLDALGLPLQQARRNAANAQSRNNQKQILLALHNYYDTHREFPKDIVDANGKPLLSWRVRLLPYLEQQALYQQFKLDEPWDSQHNRPLSEIAVPVFRSPLNKDLPPHHTVYLAPVAEGTIYGPDGPTKFEQITDGTSYTIVTVEAAPDRAVPWAQPADWQVDWDNPFDGLGATRLFGRLDGSVGVLPETVDADTLRAALGYQDGQVISF